MSRATDPRVRAFERLLEIVDRLRAPDGCPWDREQTLASMVPCLQEEAAEVADAVTAARTPAVAEELGDLLMNVLLMARIAQDDGQFDLATVCEQIADKLVRRHPHVFAEARADTPEEVLAQWQRIKDAERAPTTPATPSAMDGVPVQWSALHRARKLVERAARRGFRWLEAADALQKVSEELRELEQARAEDRTHRERELGDLLFASVAFAHRVDLDAERALRLACESFERRFRAMESMGAAGEELTLDQWLERWQRAKRETGPAGEESAP